MTKDNIAEEQKYLEQFLKTDTGKNWYEKYEIIKCNKSEAPDYIFGTLNNEKVALEITNFIADNPNAKFTQVLTTVGNQVCQYIKKTYGVSISLLIDKFDKRKWCASTREEILYAAHNPGFPEDEIPNRKELKMKIQDFLESNIVTLKNGWLAQGCVQIEDDFYNISADGFPSVCSGEYDCHVNNAGRCSEDPIDEIQKCINKKNSKIQNYMKKCKECCLLIVSPKSSKGNFCCFSDRIKKHKFVSEFADTFLYDQNDRIAYELKTKKKGLL